MKTVTIAMMAAWVLWTATEEKGIPHSNRTIWRIVDGYETIQECRRMMPSLWPTGVRYVCLPAEMTNPR